MIQNVVFVLGAGASHPYGFPTGKEMRKEIIDRHVVDSDAFVQAHPGRDGLQVHSAAQEFVNAFHKSSTESIDLFLSRNPEFSKIGKRAIIFRILDAELHSVFREKANKEQDWYMWLYKKMTDKLVEKEDYSRFCEYNKNVSFITFNYDRSLEHFLHDSLTNSFVGIPVDKIIEQLNHIKICHIFGQAGLLEWQSQDQDSGIRYRAKVNETDVDALCDNIKIVYEIGESPEFKEAQKLIREAERVFFLGFGYAEENLNGLDILSVLKDVSRVYGTALGLTLREIAKVKSLFEAKIHGKTRIVQIDDKDSLSLLRSYL